MSNSGNYYDHSTYPQTGAAGSSASLRAELDSIEAGFNKLPTLTGNANKLVKVDGSAVGLDTIAAPAGSIVGTTDTQTLTNKTVVVAINTITTASSGNLAATELNAALAELQGDIDTRATSVSVSTVSGDLANHLIDTADAHDASAISSVSSGNLSATDVQSALNELQSDIDTRAVSTAVVAKTSSTGSAVIPARTTAERDSANPTPTAGLFGYNTTTLQFEGANGTAWGSIGGAGATGGGLDKIFANSDILLTTDYLLGSEAIILPVTTAASDTLTSTAHGFIVDQPVQFATTGTLDTLLIETGYWVVAVPTADTFKVSATQGGSPITLGGAGTGVHTVGKLKNSNVPALLVIATGKTLKVPTNATLVITG